MGGIFLRRGFSEVNFPRGEFSGGKFYGEEFSEVGGTYRWGVFLKPCVLRFDTR